MKISLIAAVDENLGIGYNNKLLVYLSEDLNRFKEITMGKNIVMGRKTFESLPKGPLKERKHIVLTRDKDFEFDGVDVYNSVKDLLNSKLEEIIVIGGEQIYNQFINYAQTLYITEIFHKFELVNAYFPPIYLYDWGVSEKSEIKEEKYKYRFVNYTRIP